MWCLPWYGLCCVLLSSDTWRGQFHCLMPLLPLFSLLAVSSLASWFKFSGFRRGSITPAFEGVSLMILAFHWWLLPWPLFQLMIFYIPWFFCISCHFSVRNLFPEISLDLHATVQRSHHQLHKRLFLHYIVLPPLSKITDHRFVGLFLDFLFPSTDPCLFLCQHHTILPRVAL